MTLLLIPLPEGVLGARALVFLSGKEVIEYDYCVHG